MKCPRCKGTNVSPTELSYRCNSCHNEEFPLHNFVNHPSHYTSHPSGVECIAITQHHNFCIGNAIKYLWRAGLKSENPTIMDLEKAKWYIQAEIERIADLEKI